MAGRSEAMMPQSKPAIIGMPGATWSNARGDTKGSSWRVAFILFLSRCRPSSLLFRSTTSCWELVLAAPDQLLFSVLRSLLVVPTLRAFAAAASHIFEPELTIWRGRSRKQFNP
jgi:hypothetical protein